MTLAYGKLSLDDRNSVPLVVDKFYSLWWTSLWMYVVTRGSVTTRLFPLSVSLNVKGKIVRESGGKLVEAVALKFISRLATMVHLYWVSGWVRCVAGDGVLTYVMDLVDQDGLDVSLSCKVKVISEFRGFDEALTAK